jgi:replicative DNA helicase
MDDNANIYSISEKLHKDRTQGEKISLEHYLKKKVKFFRDAERETLNTLASKIATMYYTPN